MGVWGEAPIRMAIFMILFFRKKIASLATFHYRTSRFMFCKKKITIILFLCQEISKRRVANGNGVKRIKPIFANKGNSGTRFEPPLYHLKYISFLQQN